MLRARTKLDQVGDTIVEVMIVLAVLGLALGICYETANRSLLNTKSAEENATATRLAQSQVESIVALAPAAAVAGPCIPGNNNPFCQSQSYCIVLSNPVASQIQTNPTSCTYNSNFLSQIYSCDGNPGFPLCAGAPGQSDTFVVQVTWTDVTGDGTDRVTQYYRDHPTQ